MVLSVKRITVEDFEAFVGLPENVEKQFEFIGGEIYEVPSNPYSSEIAAFVSAALVLFVRANKLGHVTGEAGGYVVSGERYAPDVAFISKDRQAVLVQEGYNPHPPNLAVEVVSPSDSEKTLRIKVVNYLAAGTVVWVVYPKTKEVEIYQPGKPVESLDINGTLDGGEVLPKFSLPVKDIFPE